MGLVLQPTSLQQTMRFPSLKRTVARPLIWINGIAKCLDRGPDGRQETPNCSDRWLCAHRLEIVISAVPDAMPKTHRLIQVAGYLFTKERRPCVLPRQGTRHSGNQHAMPISAGRGAPRQRSRECASSRFPAKCTRRRWRASTQRDACNQQDRVRRIRLLHKFVRPSQNASLQHRLMNRHHSSERRSSKYDHMIADASQEFCARCCHSMNIWPDPVLSADALDVLDGCRFALTVEVDHYVKVASMVHPAGSDRPENKKSPIVA